MNSGFDPLVVAPSSFKLQTASQQVPFHFGGSQVPLHLAMRGNGIGSSKKIKPLTKEEILQKDKDERILQKIEGMKKRGNTKNLKIAIEILKEEDPELYEIAKKRLKIN